MTTVQDKLGKFVFECEKCDTPNHFRPDVKTDEYTIVRCNACNTPYLITTQVLVRYNKSKIKE